VARENIISPTSVNIGEEDLQLREYAQLNAAVTTKIIRQAHLVQFTEKTGSNVPRCHSYGHKGLFPAQFYTGAAVRGASIVPPGESVGLASATDDRAVRAYPRPRPPEAVTAFMRHRHASSPRGASRPRLRQQSVDGAPAMPRGRVHRLATLATVLAGQGTPSTRQHRRWRCSTTRQAWNPAVSTSASSVRHAIGDVSGGRASAEMAERIADMTAAPCAPVADCILAACAGP